MGDDDKTVAPDSGLVSRMVACQKRQARELLTNMLRMPVQTLRVWGLCGLGIGLCIVWIGRML